MRKKLVFLFIAVAAWFFAFALPVSANTYGDYTYTLDGSTATITAYTGNGGTVTIPAKIGTASVTAIGPYAFYTQDSLTAVTIPGTVLEVGPHAFDGCNGLLSLDVGTGVTTVREGAFARCATLAKLNWNAVSAQVAVGAFDSSGSNTDGICLSFGDNVKVVPAAMFLPSSGNSPAKIVTVSFGKKVAQIGADAFTGCPLTTVTLPRTIATIGKHAFGYDLDGDNIQKNALTIRGFLNTGAETYARENGFTFFALGAYFTDVPEGTWYCPYIDDLAVMGVLKGYKNNDGVTFSCKPDKNVTRGEFAVMLAKAAGVDINNYDWGVNPFTDVAPGSWFSGSVLWAYDHGIVNGVYVCVYFPDHYITRQDMAVMTARFANYQKIPLTPTQSPLSFADQGNISDYAVKPVAVLQSAGILSGTVQGGKTYYYPQASATRAQAAVMISRLLALTK